MNEFIKNNISELLSPIGKIIVVDLDSESIVAFEVSKNKYASPYDMYDDSNKNVVNTLYTDANYIVCIPTKNLEVGHKYCIFFTGGQLEMNAGGERTLSMTGTYANWSIGIGAYNPNDDEEMMQAYRYSEKMGYLERGFIQSPATFDERNFQEYVLDVNNEVTGYIFRLLDKSKEYIYFNVAWIDNACTDPLECESALDLWVSSL